MSDERYALGASDTAGKIAGGRFRFRTRHILFLTFLCCAILGIPGMFYIVGIVLGAGVSFMLIFVPLIALQFLFILLIPALRKQLLVSPDAAVNLDAGDETLGSPR
jgi:hypothetical protein